MLHVNPNLVFLGYLVLVTALCPIFERLSNLHSGK
jgi:hypothetical protein